MTERDDRIRELAYFLWMEEGCPDGAADRHWFAAETLADSEPLERKQTEGEPAGDPAGVSPTLIHPTAPERGSDLTELTRSVAAQPKRSGRGRGLDQAERPGCPFQPPGSSHSGRAQTPAPIRWSVPRSPLKAWAEIVPRQKKGPRRFRRGP